MIDHRALWITLAIALGVSSARAQIAPMPTYRYQEDHLILGVDAPAGTQKVDVEWRAVTEDGRLATEVSRKSFGVHAGANEVALQVGAGNSHRVTLRLAKRMFRVWANRGSWFTSPDDLPTAREPLRGPEAEGLLSPADTLLSSGFAATTEAEPAGRHLEVGRLLGSETGSGLRPAPGEALVLVLRGTVGAVVVTLTERMGEERVRYWDYGLHVGPEARRYVIPLRRFRVRKQAVGTPRSLLAVSVRSLSPTRRGGQMAIEALALAPPPPQLGTLVRSSAGVMAKVGGLRASAGTTRLYVAAEGAPARELKLDGRGTAMIADPSARSVWVCSENDGARTCDPPDAPSSSYEVPAGSNEPIVVEDFHVESPVNRFRLPTMVFAANEEMERTLGIERRAGSIALSFRPSTEKDYAGYFTPLREDLGEYSGSVELSLRGTVAPAAIALGLRDHAGREPKVRLSGYWNDSTASGWQTVRVPIEALQAALAASGFSGRPRLEGLSGISLTVEADGGAAPSGPAQRLEIGPIRLLPEVSPLVLASFDEPKQSLTSVHGVIRAEQRGSARIDWSTDAQGHEGRALSIEVQAIRAHAYGMLSLAFGRVDARRYGTLSLWVRGEKGGENATLYLRDRRHRGKVDLASYVRITTEWQRASIPLAAFSPKIDRQTLRQLVLAWEGRDVAHERVFVDGVTVE